MRSAFAVGLASAGSALVLAACGGGGGPANPTPDPPSQQPTNPSLPLNPPPTAGAEYTRSFGLAAINANAGYAVGATGKGVKVAVIDTGFDLAAPDMQGAYNADTTDIVAGRGQVRGVDRHGSQVASVLAARFNGAGSIGVAYEASVTGIRADSTADTFCPNSCIFTTEGLATAIDYAVAKGARVVNLSIGAYESSPSGDAALQAALTRAQNAGLVFTVAAGNGSDSNPVPTAAYAADSRYLGSVLAVGALNASGALASFSNRAGTAAQGYLAAPGEGVTADCDANGACTSVSGTSYAAPHVAGALAMLLQYFPNLSGRDAVSILLQTADDKGDAGTDSVFGRGSLNLTRAFQPIGSRTLSLEGGAQIDLPTADPASMLGAAFGDSLSRSGSLETIIRDDYQRMFQINLADSYRAAHWGQSLARPDPMINAIEQALPLTVGTTLALAAEMPMFPNEDRERSPGLALLRPEDPSSARASVQIGRFGFTAWRGYGETIAPAGLAGRNAFTSVAAPDRTVSASWSVGAFAFGVEGGWGERRLAQSLTPVQASSYTSASAVYSAPGFALSLAAGGLSEPRGAFGSELAFASPLSLAASTRFIALGFDRPLGGLSLHGEASMGHTEAGGRLVKTTDLTSSSWRFALSGACDYAGLCSSFGLELAQPLRVESGAFLATLADVPLNYDDPVTFSQRRISAEPSSRQVDLRLNLQRDLAAGQLMLQAAAMFNPGHEARETGLGLMANWRIRR